MGVIQLTREIPVDMLLALSTEELGLKILFRVRRRGDTMFHPEALQNEMWGDFSGRNPGYPRKAEVGPAVVDAWALHQWVC